MSATHIAHAIPASHSCSDGGAAEHHAAHQGPASPAPGVNSTHPRAGHPRRPGRQFCPVSFGAWAMDVGGRWAGHGDALILSGVQRLLFLKRNAKRPIPDSIHSRGRFTPSILQPGVPRLGIGAPPPAVRGPAPPLDPGGRLLSSDQCLYDTSEDNDPAARARAPAPAPCSGHVCASAPIFPRGASCILFVDRKEAVGRCSPVGTKG